MGVWTTVTTWTQWHTFAAIGASITWLIEWARVASDEGAARRARSLRGDIFQNYRQSLRDGLDSFARFIGEYEDRPRNFSVVSYWASVGWATLYPFLFLATGWALLGAPGRFGSLALFSDGASEQQRLITLGGLLLALMGPVTVRVLMTNFGYPIVVAATLAGFFAGSVAVAFVIAFAGFGAIAFAFAVAGALVGAFAVAFAVAGAGTVAVGYAVVGAVVGAFAAALFGAFVSAELPAFAVAFVVAGVFAGAFAVLWAARFADRYGRSWLTVAVIASVLLLLPLMSSTFLFPDASHFGANPTFNSVPTQTVNPMGSAEPVVLFLMLLPAINAPLDWLSLGISRFLIRQMATAKDGAWALFDSSAGGILEFFVISLDLLLALALAFLVVVATAFFVSLFSSLHVVTGGDGFFNVANYVGGVRADPRNPQYYWIYAMMFWTLVPTLVHFTVYSGSIVMIGLKPLNVGSGLATWLELSSPLARIAPAFFLTALRLLPALTAGFLLVSWSPWLLYELGWTWSIIGNGLADASRDAAEVARLLVGG